MLSTAKCCGRRFPNLIAIAFATAIGYPLGAEAYGKVWPLGQHQACAKKEGQTNHVERFNLTMRQSVARLVRKTLSFSKRLLPHLRALRHFLVQYNLRKAREYQRKLAKLASAASPQ